MPTPIQLLCTKQRAEIDRLAAELWGLSEQELEDIQGSLADLQ